MSSLWRRTDHGLDRLLSLGVGNLGSGFLHSSFVGPNHEKFGGRAGFDEANRYQSGVDDQVKFDVTKGRHPFRPLNFCGHACSIDGPWGDRMGRESKATSARSTKGLRRD